MTPPAWGNCTISSQTAAPIRVRRATEASTGVIEQGKHMSFSGIFAQFVALIGAAAVQWRRLQGVPQEAAWGSAPVVPAAKPQGSIPTLKMPTARGWSDG